MSSSSRRRIDALRRAGVRAAAAATAALVVSACGFHLRGQASYAFTSIYVTVPSSPAFETEMRRTVAGSGSATLAEGPSNAHVVLDVGTVSDDKQVLSLTSGGRVREFALAKRVVFRLYDREGREWVPSNEIVVRRTYLYDDTQRLAREIQESRLLREMQSDAIQQIVRQLQSVRAPA